MTRALDAYVHSWAALVLTAAAVAGWWADLYFHPYAPCRACGGSDRNKGSRRGAYGVCPHGPRRVRVGARMVHSNLRRK